MSIIGKPLQAPGCEQQPGKAVWSTIHSSPRHSRPLKMKIKMMNEDDNEDDDEGCLINYALLLTILEAIGGQVDKFHQDSNDAGQ